MRDTGTTIEVAGVSIPKLGFGTFTLQDDACRTAVVQGINEGFRHLDTAEMYGNEAAVADGLRASGLPRDDIFVTTKVWHENLAPARLTAAAEASLRRMKLDYVDLYLIHWPSPEIAVEEAVGALNDVLNKGLTRAIGISNFPVTLMDRAVAASNAPLAVNQVEYHPFLDQTPVRDALARHRMALTAYCPLARGKVLETPVLKSIAERHDTSAATVALAWLLRQDGVIAIPKTGSRGRMAENFSALRFAELLTDEELSKIDQLRSPDGRLISPDFAPEWDRAA